MKVTAEIVTFQVCFKRGDDFIKIKICGITNEKEIEYLNIIKPDYIGFVFTQSKRMISAENAEKLRQKLNPEIKCVGVFKDNSLEEINNVLKTTKLNIIQLHGHETFDFIDALNKNNESSFEVWKAISIKNKLLLNEYMSCYIRMKNKALIDNILIDGSNPGSGETYSLEPFKKIIKKECGEYKKNSLKFILAGGITPENVIERIHEAGPWGVDVSSGVEEIDSNGISMKSFKKMNDLFYKVKEGHY